MSEAANNLKTVKQYLVDNYGLVFRTASIIQDDGICIFCGSWMEEGKPKQGVVFLPLLPTEGLIARTKEKLKEITNYSADKMKEFADSMEA